MAGERTSNLRDDITLICERSNPEHFRLREMLTRAAQPHDWFEPGSPQAAELLKDHPDDLELPILIDGDLVMPGVTVESLIHDWALDAPPQKHHYDTATRGSVRSSVSVRPSAKVRWPSRLRTCASKNSRR